MTYSIVKNIVPVRNLGNINALDYVDGPRTIAGSLVFAVFDRHWTDKLRQQLKEKGLYTTTHFVADELPPFDVTITFANEYGYASRLAIYGIRLANEGQTMSMHDMYVENTYQYVATDIDYMENILTPETDRSIHRDNNTEASVVVNKPIETIPVKSNIPLDTPKEETMVQTSDDYSYSTLKPQNFNSLTAYKRNLNVAKTGYKKKAEDFHKQYPDKQKEYESMLQTISSNYTKKISEGISYFNQKKKGGGK